MHLGVLMAQSKATPCENCGRLYNHALLTSCPGCRVTHGSGIDRYVDPASLTPEFETQRLLKEVLKSTNRTTYAVRAVVSLSAILLLTAGIVYVLILIAGLLTALGSEGTATFTLFLAWVLGIIGTIAAYRQFIKEWLLSDVPDGN